MSIPQFEAPKIEEVHALLPAYDVLNLIAKGGMGAVYRARQISLDRDVAIKILPREFGEDEDFRRSFGAEARVMAKLNHPNLVAVYDFGEVDGMPYIVMEYVHGKALHYSAHGMMIEQTEAARLTLGICEGLGHAHRAGVLHRDIKPANILLDPKKRPKIGDFGLASVLESNEGGELLFGTPGYCAPEVVHAPDQVDARSDVYSTGVLFYELLTGELPGEPHVPASQKATVDSRFDQIIRRAIHPSPNLRFSDAGEMAEELSKLVDEGSTPLAPKLITSGPVPKARPLGGRGVALAAPKLSVSSPGPNWPLLRNLVIIVVLLGAIVGMTKAIGRKEAAYERQELKQLADKQERERAAEEALANLRAGGGARARVIPVVDKSTSTPLEEEPETPLDALARLRRPLARGERTLFPPQTLARGSSRYLLIETPMTWEDAGAFAKEHGAHLATVPSEAEGTWIASKIPANTVIWLGGGLVGRGAWEWVDGSAWTVRKPYAVAGTNPTLSDFGTIRAKPAGEKYPFFIQWKIDGKSPGSLQVQLQRTKGRWR